jgi:copper chaperone CopZ
LQVPLSPTTGPDSTPAPDSAASPSADEPGQAREAEVGTGTAEATFYVPALITAPTFSDGCCVWASDQWVTARIQSVHGVRQVLVNKEKATVQVTYDPAVIQPTQIAEELAGTGYPAERQLP